MSSNTETGRVTAAKIAMDLATLIYQGILRAGQEVPSRARLMAAYNVAGATATSAVDKLVAAGLVETSQGTTTRVRPRWQWRQGPALMFKAANLLRTVAAMEFHRGRPEIAMDVVWDKEGAEAPLRVVPVETLTALDRTVLVALSEAMFRSAMNAVGNGMREEDERMVAAAKALLRDGGRRPEQQAPIAGSWMWDLDGTDDGLVGRLWPEWVKEVEDGAPF